MYILQILYVNMYILHVVLYLLQMIHPSRPVPSEGLRTVVDVAMLDTIAHAAVDGGIHSIVHPGNGISFVGSIQAWLEKLNSNRIGSYLLPPFPSPLRLIILAIFLKLSPCCRLGLRGWLLLPPPPPPPLLPYPPYLVYDQYITLSNRLL